ncbi:sugar ABC transporter permease [Halalkalicoccus tibetensis]|uniref:Carbohydrate ABC transporter permease n=1 Tax=Halalkalicoccus tibetensis TaxID=175632 RepID=A0ABD5VDE6_9EURY
MSPSSFKEKVLDNDDRLYGYLFVLPDLMTFIAFLFIPVATAFILSLFEWSTLGGAQGWVGLDNYINLLKPYPWENNFAPLRSPEANLWWYAVRNTVIYITGVVPLAVYGGLGAALLLDSDIPGEDIVRAMYFIPVMLSPAAIAIIWRWILADQGIANEYLSLIGLSHNWATSTATALPSVMLMAIWANIGFNMIIYLSGLQNIPSELYDAARIDGAGTWEKFRNVTWPNLNDITFFVIVLAIINGFQVFAYAYVFAQGGPYNATTTIVVYIYQRGFGAGDLGSASAMAVMLFIFIFLFSYYQYTQRNQQEVSY